MQAPARRGRKARYSHFEDLHRSLAPGAKKRPTYVDGIGLFRGERGTTAWIKLTLRRPNIYRGRSYPAGAPVEIKLGSLDSWTWEQLEDERRRLRARSDDRVGGQLREGPIVLYIVLNEI
jgi:hypothetical protein